MAKRLTLAWRFPVSLIVLLCGATSVAARSPDRPPTVVTMGGDSGYPPYQFLNAAGRPSGFDVELLKAIAAESGFTVKFQLGDWGKTLERLKAGKLDVVPMFISPERRKIYDFSNPYIVRYHLIFSRKGAPYISNLKDLAGKQVIVQRAGLAADTLTHLGIKVIPILTNKEPDAVRLLAAGAHGYALVPAFIGRYAIKEYGLNNIVVSGPPVLTKEYAFAVTKGNRALVEVFNAGLAQLHSSGQFEKIYATWLANLEPPHKVRAHLLKWFLSIATALLALISALLVFSQKLRTRVRQQATALKHELTRRHQAEKQARFLAYNDVLTELPNRNKFVHDLEHAILDAKGKNGRLAVACLRIVNLGQINEAAGYHVGDDLLKQVGKELAAIYGLRASALAPGLFAIRLDHPANPDAAASEVNALLNRLRNAREIRGISLEVNFLGGLAVFPEHSDATLNLIRNAELALRVASDGGHRLVSYSKDYEPDPRNLRLLADLPRAIRQQEFILYCQPKLDLKSAAINGGEILVRWKHPQFELLAPNVFVPLAEKSGFIRQMTLHVIERTADYVRNRCPSGDNPKFSVNISAKDLSTPDFAKDAQKLVEGYSQRHIFEITETAAMHDTDAVLRTAAALREAGIHLSIDDYGTGYSSLSYIRQLAPDELKIDRTFVSNMLTSRDDWIVVESTIHLAHDLGITVIAEGVEDLETIMALKQLGCDTVQGYGIAKPMPIETFAEWSATSDMVTFTEFTSESGAGYHL